MLQATPLNQEIQLQLYLLEFAHTLELVNLRVTKKEEKLSTDHKNFIEHNY